MLAKYSGKYQQDWDVFLLFALFTYRTIRQNTTQYESFHLTYGRDAMLLIELSLPSFLTEEKLPKEFEKLYFDQLQQLIEKISKDR